MRSSRPRASLSHQARLSISAIVVAASWLYLGWDNHAAGSTNWTGAATTDNFWGTADNWDGAIPSSGNSPLFYDTGSAAAAGTVTNVLEGDYEIPVAFFYNTTGNFHTTDLGGNLLTVDQTFANQSNAGLQVNWNRLTTTNVTFTNGDIVVGKVSDGRSNILVGVSTGDTSTDYHGVLDLGGVSSLDAYLQNFHVGERGWGEMTLADENTIDAVDIMVGGAYVNAGLTSVTSTLKLGSTNTIKADTWTIGGRKAVGLVEFQDSVANGTLDLAGANGPKAELRIGHNNAGTGSISEGTLDLRGGTFNAALSTLTLGEHYGGTGGGRGTLIMEAGAVTADAVHLAYPSDGGTSSNPTNTTGTLQMFGGTFTAGSVQDKGGVSEIQLDGDVKGGSLVTATMTVNGDFSVDKLRVGYDGGAGHLTVNGGTVSIGDGTGDFDIGRRLDGPADSVGEVDLSAATSATISVDNLRMGTVSYGTAGAETEGILRLPTAVGSTSNITATEILMGSDWRAGLPDSLNQILLGDTTTMEVDTWIVAGAKAQADVKFAGSGTINLSGRNNDGADLFVGYNAVTTGSIANGDADFSGGTFDATLDEIILGYHNAGTGGGNGTLTFDAGTVTANSLTLSQPSATGTSSNPEKSVGTLHMRGGALTVDGDVVDGGGVSHAWIDGGTLDATGDLTVDDLRVGAAVEATVGSRSATVSASGNVVIGNAGGTTNLDIARRTYGGNISGTLDLQNAASVDINVDQLRLGYGTASDQGTLEGHLLLSTSGSNSIKANDIILGNSAPNGNPSGTVHTILFGENNNVEVGEMIVGGRKSSAALEIVAGGELNLTGPGGGEADLRIGYNDIHTGSQANGTADFTGATFNAKLDELTIGRHRRDSGNVGSGTGHLTVTDGLVTANTVLIGDGTDPGGPADGKSNGTLTLDGTASFEAGSIELGVASTTASGTIELRGNSLLVADSIDDGVGSAAFDYTGGTLAVDNFGFDLQQDGGTLSPGNSIGTTTIDGNYTLNGGDVFIEIDGDAGPGVSGGHDQLTVIGDVTLGGALTLDWDYLPEVGTSFLILEKQPDGPISGIFDDLPEGARLSASHGGETVGLEISYVGGNGNDVVLGAVPEPSAMVLLLLGAGGLLAFGRRRS